MKRLLIFAALVLAGLAYFIWPKISGGPSDAGGNPMMGGRGPLPVTVFVATPGEVHDRATALGNSRAVESVLLTASVTEVIREIRFEEGQQVAKDDVIVVLDQAEEQAELAAAQARLHEHGRELRRLKTLMARNVAARREYDERTTLREVTRAEIREIEARIEDRVIRAPFAGVLGQRDLSLGALLRPGDPVTTLDDLSRIRIDFRIPALFLSQLKVGLKINVRSDALGDRRFGGEVVSFATRVDPATRSVRVRAILPNPDRLIVPGLLIHAELLLNAREGLMVPEESVIQAGADHFLRIVDVETSTAVQRKVRIGIRAGGQVEIVDGIEPGDRVIVRGMDRARPGQAVKVLNADDSTRDSAA